MALASRTEIVEEKHPTNLDFNSPSVGILSQHFLGPGKFRVLDLGAPTRSTLEFFSSNSCRYYVEDLNQYFIEPRKRSEHDNGEDDDVADALADALGYEDAARFDLVLGWDLFSYMDRAAIEILMSRVARSCRAGTLLFLTAPTGAMIPSRPARITMNQRGRLDYRSEDGAQSIANPQFSPTALENMMPGFRLLHSFLLGDEMQEFLFSYT